MITRNLSKVQEILDEFSKVQEQINELSYFKKELEAPNHSDLSCTFVSSTINHLNLNLSKIVEALNVYGKTYECIDQELTKINRTVK